MGPAGSGKTTYCNTMLTHCQSIKRNVHLINLDPAAENFQFEPTIEDAMDEVGLGPNGGLVYCLEFLLQNMDWFQDELGSYEDDYLFIDCPGQIELYTHSDIMTKLCEALQQWDFRIVGIYLLESQFVEDKSKFFSGVLSALSAMVNLEIPHLNVFTKMDLVEDKTGWDKYLVPDPYLLEESDKVYGNDRFADLNRALVHLIDEHSMVNFLTLDITDTDSVEAILSHADYAIQYGEEQEPVEPKFDEEEYE